MNRQLQTESNFSWEHILKIKDNPHPRSMILKEGENGIPLLVEESKTHEPTSLRREIEPWVTALFQSEHLALLLGAGLSNGVQYLATGTAGAGSECTKLTEFGKEIESAAAKAAVASGRGTPNIEDQLRAIDNLLCGLSIYAPDNATFRGSGVLKKKRSRLEAEQRRVLKEFADAILSSEARIAKSKSLLAFNALTKFLLSFASRSATRQRLHIFTTNYDRVIEFGAELAGLRLMDRFVGNICPVFRSSRLEVDLHYNPPGIRGEPRYLEGVVHFTKLHGSLDWIYSDGYVRRTALPFGASEIMCSAPTIEAAMRSLMIYPNSAKDRETAEYPYVELFRDFAAAVCRPNSSLVVYGYSFGDEHINRVIEDMLTIPSTHLVIISYDDKHNRIQSFYERMGRPAQFSILLGQHFGDLRNLVEYYLPKPAIDRSTIRMVELLKARGIAFGGTESQRIEGDVDSERES